MWMKRGGGGVEEDVWIGREGGWVEEDVCGWGTRVDKEGRGGSMLPRVSSPLH